MPLILVALALSLVACSAEAPPPVTATRVLEVSGLQRVVNAVALSADGGLRHRVLRRRPDAGLDLGGRLRPGDDQGRGPYGLEVWRVTYEPRPR